MRAVGQLPQIRDGLVVGESGPELVFDENVGRRCFVQTPHVGACVAFHLLGAKPEAGQFRDYSPQQLHHPRLRRFA